MDQIFSLQGWTPQSNKNSLDHAIDSFGKGENPWQQESLAGTDSLGKFSILWARYHTSKPKPNREEQKRALIYGLAMVGCELNSQVVLLKEHADQGLEKCQQQIQQAEQQATELQAAKATVTALTLQVAQVEQQLRDLSAKAAAAERKAELIKEAADNRERPASHVECQHHIK
ncbi:hypothetical protein KIL84_011543 [Mauremys mutica]|uniref:Uncharacterized protein n=1 Tax=Mauremys mutica TaxID=74926 RepID=A0A9D4B2E6_9SAUR|nr:hypothetical protein KIL84_011543 [Mauremys mutica]